MFIYKITNLINGKVYIGQTTKPVTTRWKQHYSSVNYYKTPLYYAIKKYSKENFTIEQIDIANDIDELNKKEYFYIKIYNTLSPNGYNMMEGGGSSGKPSLETRAKMSKGQRLRHESHPNPRCRQVIDINTGYVYTSAKECYDFNKGILSSYSSLMDKIKGRYSNNTSFRYVGMESICKEEQRHQGRCIIDTKTKQIYVSLICCSEITGIKQGTLKDWLTNKHPNKSDLVYLDKYSEKL